MSVSANDPFGTLVWNVLYVWDNLRRIYLKTKQYLIFFYFYMYLGVGGGGLDKVSEGQMVWEVLLCVAFIG